MLIQQTKLTDNYIYLLIFYAITSNLTTLKNLFLLTLIKLGLKMVLESTNSQYMGKLVFELMGFIYRKFTLCSKPYACSKF